MLLTLTAFISSALRTTIPVGTIGLALAYVMQLAGLFQWCTRQSVEVENLSTAQPPTPIFSLRSRSCPPRLVRPASRRLVPHPQGRGKAMYPGTSSAPAFPPHLSLAPPALSHPPFHLFSFTLARVGTRVTVTSVERMINYTELTPEAPPVTDVRPPEGWPSRGEIVFNKMSLIYPDTTEPVLRGTAWSRQPSVRRFR